MVSHLKRKSHLPLRRWGTIFCWFERWFLWCWSGQPLLPRSSGLLWFWFWFWVCLWFIVRDSYIVFRFTLRSRLWLRNGCSSRNSCRIEQRCGLIGLGWEIVGNGSIGRCREFVEKSPQMDEQRHRSEVEEWFVLESSFFGFGEFEGGEGGKSHVFELDPVRRLSPVISRFTPVFFPKWWWFDLIIGRKGKKKKLKKKGIQNMKQRKYSNGLPF